MTNSSPPSDLEARVRALYRGPLEEFIARRDALAKELRAEKRRDEADRVKALRKPSRMAWALNQVVFDDPSVVERLERAISGAQKGRAQDDVRAAVRGVAEAGEQASTKAGSPVASSALVTALRAVIGDADSLAHFRAGRLVEIPAGGGLDLLVSLVPSAPQRLTVSAPEPKAGREDAEAAAVRAELQRAEALLANARERAAVAERAVIRAKAKLDAAEERLQQAQREADERRAELERARADADTAAQEVAAAERTMADLRERR